MMIGLGEFVVMGFVTVRSEVGLGVGGSPRVMEKSGRARVVEQVKTWNVGGRKVEA